MGTTKLLGYSLTFNIRNKYKNTTYTDIIESVQMR